MQSWSVLCSAARSGKLLALARPRFRAQNGSRWLDVTPTSRVIARCTQDIQAGEWERLIHYHITGLLTLSLFVVDGKVSDNLTYLSKYQI